MNATLPSAPPSLRHSRAGFERIPANLSRTELFRYFTFTEEDQREIDPCRGDYHKIGFALLLGGVRLTGRVLYDCELVPRSLVAHICDQLALGVPLFLTYPQRRPTRAEHIERIKSSLGLRSCTAADRLFITHHVRERVRAGARPHKLLPSREQMLRAHAIALPGVTVLQKRMSSARVAAEEELFGELSGRVDEATTERLLALLQVQLGERLTPFQQFQLRRCYPPPEKRRPLRR